MRCKAENKLSAMMPNYCEAKFFLKETSIADCHLVSPWGADMGYGKGE
jgi:hypothetical protein